MNPLPLVLATLRRHRAAFALFVGLVACAVALGIAVTASERALRQASARAADKFDLIAAAPGSRTDITLAAIYLRPGTVPLLDAAAVARVLGESRAALAAPLAFGDSFQGAPVVGTIATFVLHLSGGLAEGRNIAAEGEAVVGTACPLALGQTFRPLHGDGVHGADADEDAAHEHPVSITVVGRMRPTGTPWDRAIIVPVEQVWRTHGLPVGHAPGVTHIGPPFDPAFLSGVPAIVVQPVSVADAYGLRSTLRGPGVMTFFPAEALGDIYAVASGVRRLASLIAGVAQMLVGLAVLAALAALFALNRQQFTTLRILGAPRAFVALTVWVYLAAIVILGAILGLAAGLGAAALLAARLTAETGIAAGAALAISDAGTLALFVCGALGVCGLLAWAAAHRGVRPG